MDLSPISSANLDRRFCLRFDSLLFTGPSQSLYERALMGEGNPTTSSFASSERISSVKATEHGGYGLYQMLLHPEKERKTRRMGPSCVFSCTRSLLISLQICKALPCQTRTAPGDWISGLRSACTCYGILQPCDVQDTINCTR